MLRVAGGRVGGRRLQVPAGIRPTQERVREAVAARWTALLPGARVLDLFCGSGAMGIEALSRGAAGGFFVDRSGAALRLVRRNLEVLELDGRTARRRLPGAPLPGSWPDRFDLVYCDPPYRFDGFAALLAQIEPLLHEESELVVETGRVVELEAAAEEAGLRRAELRRYGDTAIHVLRQEP